MRKKPPAFCVEERVVHDRASLRSEIVDRVAVGFESRTPGSGAADRLSKGYLALRLTGASGQKSDLRGTLSPGMLNPRLRHGTAPPPMHLSYTGVGDFRPGHSLSRQSRNGARRLQRRRCPVRPTPPRPAQSWAPSSTLPAPTSSGGRLRRQTEPPGDAEKARELPQQRTNHSRGTRIRERRPPRRPERCGVGLTTGQAVERCRNIPPDRPALAAPPPSVARLWAAVELEVCVGRGGGPEGRVAPWTTASE
jgi:hypothetical protein